MEIQTASQILAGHRPDFPSLERAFCGRPLTYFDGPAGTQMPLQVIESIANYYTTCNSNTHGCFVTTRESDLLLQETRRVIATFLGAKNLHDDFARLLSGAGPVDFRAACFELGHE